MKELQTQSVGLVMGTELTPLRKELGINVLKVLLIHHTARTLLGYKCEVRKLISSHPAQNIYKDYAATLAVGTLILLSTPIMT